MFYFNKTKKNVLKTDSDQKSVYGIYFFTV